MTETMEADQFFDKIYELVTGNLNKTKGMDVIMLLGGTGCGKSTLLNMIAGNQITASRVRGEWHLNSNPSVAMIGHGESTTFEPNYWEGNGLRIYDCPGFNDTRSLQYEISKSFFIKEIADNAKSFKIILVGDIHSVKGGRCGPFLAYLKQLKDFIPDYNSSNDYSLVITKAYSDILPEYIAEDFKIYAKVQISPTKANLIFEPESKGKYDYSYINFKAIFDSAPSISSKCNLPLSAEAKLKLGQIREQLNHSVIKTVKALTIAIRIYYFQVLTNKIEADNTYFKKVFQTFQQRDIQSTTPEGFVKSLEKYCLKLHNLCQVGFNFSSYFSVINKKIDQMDFLKKKVDSFNINIQSWVQCISFNCQEFKKSTNAETMRNLDSLSSFLRNTANIDINKPIEEQAHQHLISQQVLRTKYSGSKQITVQLEKNDICQKTLNKQFIINQLFEKSIPYSGSVRFSDSKYVNGTVSVESCSIDKGIFKRCWSCNHYNKTLEYSHRVECSGYADYKGDVHHRQRQTVESSVTIQLQKDFHVKKTCKQTVKYDGEHDAVCQRHHKCSCEGLAKIAFSAKNLLEDILCYQQIKVAQEKQIATLKNNNYVQVADDAHLPIADLSLENYKITNGQLTLKEITDRIHEKLTQRYLFSYPYTGSINIKVEKPYCQNIRFKGAETVTRTVKNSAYVPYRGYTSYRKDQQYSGSVKAQTCYMNCSFCTSSTFYKSFSGSLAFSGAVQYSGTVYTSESRSVMKQIPYDEQVPCAGTVQRNLWVQYDGTSQVCCEKGSSLGQGHHDCTSCKTWDKFVSAFKKFIEIKTKVIKQVQDNMQVLSNLASSSSKK